LVGKDWGSQGVRVDDVLEFEEVVGVGEEEVVVGRLPRGQHYTHKNWKLQGSLDG